MNVKLIAKTVICNEALIEELKGFNGSEELIMYCARVSNPENQASNKPALLKYCLDHGHVSIFEMSDMIIEIETSRAISPQILRHRSFVFQEFSQRYAKVQGFEKVNWRRQDTKNRQNSIDDLSQEDKDYFNFGLNEIQTLSRYYYDQAIQNGVAKESARFLLPLTTCTKLYMKGSIRSWIHYINVRSHESTQLEHREIALAIKAIFIEQFPIISKALDWG